MPHARFQASSSRAAAAAALFAVVLGAVMGLMAAGAAARMKQETLILVTATGERTLSVEVAQTDEERALGLMFRTSLPEGTGMLFPYAPPQEVSMWMRNTYISLDMVFIRADGVVHRIETRTQPMSDTIIPSRGIVAAVLELPAGDADRLGLRAGDRVRHPHFEKHS
jgi:uncharacterized membrane protein (UPF0127 family)